MKCKTCIHNKVCRFGNTEFWASGQEYDLIEKCTEYVDGKLRYAKTKMSLSQEIIQRLGDNAVKLTKREIAFKIAQHIADSTNFELSANPQTYTIDITGTINYVEPYTMEEWLDEIQK